MHILQVYHPTSFNPRPISPAISHRYCVSSDHNTLPSTA
jgi:hypothetical protein